MFNLPPFKEVSQYKMYEFHTFLYVTDLTPHNAHSSYLANGRMAQNYHLRYICGMADESPHTLIIFKIIFSLHCILFYYFFQVHNIVI